MFTPERIEEHRANAVIHATNAVQAITRKNYIEAERQFLCGVAIMCALQTDELERESPWSERLSGARK